MKSNSFRSASLVIGLLFLATQAPAASDYSSPFAFSTLAGDSSIGSNDGPGRVARFYTPRGIALDATGNLYVTDALNQNVRKITPAGVVSTLAGTAGVFGMGRPPSDHSPIDGTGASAVFSNPEGIAVDRTGTIYVTDKMAFLVRKITPEGVVTTLAGAIGEVGSTDGTGSAARFHVQSGAATDSAGNVYTTDWGNHIIRKITPAGIVTTLAGQVGVSGHADGKGDQASFFQPMGIAADAAGNLYVADCVNGTIRKITPDGTVTTLAGQAGVSGSADGATDVALFRRPEGVTVDTAGNVFVADTWNGTIRKISATGKVTTVAGTPGLTGSTDGNGPTARFRVPGSIVVNPSGILFVTDEQDNTVRKISPNGDVTTLAGLGLDYAFGSADGTKGRFDRLGSAAVGPNGEVYVADTLNATIRKVAIDGTVSTLAGKAGVRGHVDATGSDARFEQPFGIAVDAGGAIYVSDPGNDTIRKISSAGVVSTFAGNAEAGAGFANGQGTAARFSFPSGLTVDRNSGALYVADSDNHVVRKISSAGEVSTFAGSPGNPGSVDGTGSATRFVSPTGVCLDLNGNLLVADAQDQTIRRISSSGSVTTLAGKSGQSGSNDGDVTVALFSGPYGIAVDKSGAIYVTDTDNQLIRRIAPSGQVTTLGGLAKTAGYANGLGVETRFQSPPSLALNAATDQLYVTSGATLRVGRLAGRATITTQPQSVSCKAGETAQFSVVANGAPAPTYQWYRNGTVIAGANAASYSLTNAQTTDAADFTVVVTNTLGSATSTKAALSVTSSASTPTPTPVPTPSNGNQAGSGGGSMNVWLASALLALGATRFARSRRTRSNRTTD